MSPDDNAAIHADSLPMRDPLASLIRRLARLGAILLLWPTAALSLLAMLASHWWLADLVVHFRIQYLAVALLGALLALGLGARTLLALAGICAALNIGPVIAYFHADLTPMELARADTQTTAPSLANVRIAGLNVFFRNTNYDGVAAWIHEINPHAVVLVEADRHWEQAMARLLPDYPTRWLSIERGSQLGKLILSREPFLARATIASRSVRADSPLVTLAVDGVRFQLTAVHTVWPMGPDEQAARNRDLLGLGEWAATASLPLIAIGDFNVSPFSPHFDRLLADSGLHRASAGRGWLPTFPAFLPLAGIQIDHLLVSSGVAVRDLRTAQGLGSDHRALIGDLQISARSTP